MSSNPLALFCKVYPAFTDNLRDIYANNLCCIDKKPIPCECGDIFNNIVKEQVPENIYDPLDLNELSPPKKVKNLIDQHINNRVRKHGTAKILRSRELKSYYQVKLT